MVPDESRAVDRRSLLKATGSAAMAAVGASGTASADHVDVGDFVQIHHQYDVQSYANACDQTFGPFFENGTGGVITDVRDCYYMGRLVEFSSLETNDPPGWMEDRYVEL